MVESPTATEDDLEKGPKTLKNGNELEKQLSEEIAGEGDRDTDDCGNTDVTRESECLNGMESGRPPLEDEERHIEKDIDSDAKPNNGGAGSGVPESPALHDNLEESHPESLIGTRNSSQKQSSSLEMRKIPVNRLLKPVPDGSVLSSEVTMLMKETPSEKKDLLRMLCLRPGFSLRTQLMLSYGSINAITTIFVIVICVIVAITAGENVKDDYTQSFADQLELGTTARLLAESLDARFMLTNMVDIIHEATLDRFEGYSNESDDEVPFLDMDSQSRKYPFIGEPLPIEWDLKTPVMNAANADELCQSRWDYYKDRPASTVNAGFHMQGVCDPTLTDPNAAAYWPNCTDANNDIATGGVVAPSQTTKQIYRKGSDLMPLLKAIFEAKEEIRDLGLYFANSGAGASMNYPQVAFVANSSYVSIGCDWMKATNPYNKSNTIGTQEMINRCHGEGVVVNSRIYNPLERAWCRDQALHPDRFYADVVADAWSNDDWLLFLGKAVYDRKNREFVACIYIGIPLGSIDEALMDVRITNKTEVSTVAWGEIGTVIVSSVTTDRRSAIYESNLGLTKESYEELYTLVDFDSKWDPEEVRGQYENFRAMDNSYVVSSYPIPAIPDEYDPNYRPVALVIVSFSSEDMFRVVKEVDGVFDEKVKEITLFSIVVGAIGLVAATIIVFTMAHVLTFPLISMDRVASEIVNNFGDPTNESLIDSADRISREVKCAPKTELSQVVKEFNKMVESFSGSYMARSENGKYEEANNLFGLKAVFSKLYKSRDDETFAYKIKEHAESSQDESSEVSDTDRFIHEGSNLLFSTTVTNGEKKSSNRDSTKPKFMSPIFFWTAVLIVTPLLAVNITITAVVMQSVSNEFTDSIATAKDYYLEVQKEALKVKTQLRASYARDFTAKSTSELHILTKYSSWLLFGGLRRADSFTEVTTGIEMCKTRYENFDECEYVQQDSVCDCEWNDGASSFCKTYPDGSRHLQVPFFVYESSATESNGNRDSNAFPNASYSIETTEWWDDPTILPGWETPSSASGLDSTYDRLRSIAALPMLQVLYNADRKKKSLIGAYVAFEADGLFFGYIGCRNSGHVALAAWNSTKENGAAQLRPELCPLGKYGYDPRCRGWYDTGKRLAIANNTALHVTPPYPFATINDKSEFAQSATSPLVDPRTGEYVGQVLQDFRTEPLYEALADSSDRTGTGFPILITVVDDSGGDTVVAPGFSLADGVSKPISEVLLPLDTKCQESECSSHLAQFGDIVKSMKHGDSGITTFSRKTNFSEEIVYMSYAPVIVNSKRPVDVSDFSRGVISSDYLVYSLAFAETESVILESFEQSENNMERQIRISIGILSAVITAAALIVIYVSHRTTMSITEPMLYLLDLIRSMNSNGVILEPPEVRTVQASKEIVVFSNTLEMLYKVVRSANTAFYAGELQVAYTLLTDALRLFKRLDNKKAIGIANNNLGNIMLAMYEEWDSDEPRKFGLTKRTIVTKGISFFHEAIQLGEKAYDEFHSVQGWSPVCLDFMQHLANRYFNRGLFLLRVKGDHSNPDELEELGRRDLNIARDMDQEVISYGEEIGWGCADRIQKTFKINISRIGGYNLLLKMGYPDDWDTEELLDETFKMISEEAKRDSSELFKTVSMTGRLQEIETELMKYKSTMGDIETASKIAIRMLLEDENVFADAQAQALEILLKYIETASEFDDSHQERIKNALENYNDMLVDYVEDRNQAAVCDLESDRGIRASFGTSSILSQKRGGSSKSWSLSQSSGRFLTMEDF